MAAIATDRKAIVNKVNEAFANNDVEGFLALCASDVVWTMVGDRTVKGKDEIRKWMGSMNNDVGFVPQHCPQRSCSGIAVKGWPMPPANSIVVSHGRHLSELRRRGPRDGCRFSARP